MSKDVLNNSRKTRWLLPFVVSLLLAVSLIWGGSRLYERLSQKRPLQVPGIDALIVAVDKHRPIEARLSISFVYEPFVPRKLLDLSKLQQPNSIIMATRSNSEPSDNLIAQVQSQRKRGAAPNPISLYDLGRFFKVSSGGDRGSDGRQSSEGDSLELKSAAANILLEDSSHPSLETSWAAGLLYLIRGEYDEAIGKLQSASAITKTAKPNGQLLNDLASAYLARAESQDRPQDLFRALSTIDLAVKADSSLIEAQFNRALILEKLYLFPLARKYWNDYLRFDPNSDWANEARAHIAKIDTPPPSAAWMQERIRLGEAIDKGDELSAFEIIKQYPNSARSYALDELIPAWADARFEGKEIEAARYLKIARAIGDALTALQNDNLVRDKVAVIYNAPAERIDKLVSANRDFRDGKKADERFEYDRSAVLFEKTKMAFALLGDTGGEAISNFYLAVCDEAKLLYPDALSKLNYVREISYRRGYLSILSRALFIQGDIYYRSFEISRAINSLNEAARYSEITGNIERVQNVDTILAQIYSKTGDTDESLIHIYRSTCLLEQSSDLLKRTFKLGVIAYCVGQTEELRASLYFFDEAIKSAIDSGLAYFIGKAYQNRSISYYRLGDRASALADLDAAKNQIEKIPDTTTRNRFQEQVLLARTECSLEENPKGAIESLTTLLKTFQKSVPWDYSTQIYLSRARAYLILGDENNSEADLKAGIRELERERESISNEEQRISFFEEPQAVYDDMIEFQITRRGRLDTAFYYSETKRARALLDALDERGKALHLDTQSAFLLDGTANSLTLDEIRRELPDNVTLIEYSVLSDRLLAWVVERDRVNLAQSVVRRETLEQMTNDFQNSTERYAKQTQLTSLSTPLYEILIKPIRQFLPANSTLVVVPDKILHTLPFAALIDPDTGRYLIQDHALMISPSATIFIRCLERDRKLANQESGGVLAVGNPKFDSQRYPKLSELPSAEAEAEWVAGLYPGSELLIGKDATRSNFLSKAEHHSVLHFAGHAIVDVNHPLYSTLVLAPEKRFGNDNTDTGALYAYELYGHRFDRTRLVVLSACRTAGGKLMRGEGMASLARPFLAAGVPAVIASLWNADDRAAAKLFAIFYEKRIAGEDSISALRTAQLELINDSDQAFRSPSTWASFVLLGGVTQSR